MSSVVCRLVGVGCCTWVGYDDQRRGRIARSLRLLHPFEEIFDDRSMPYVPRHFYIYKTLYNKTLYAGVV